MLQYIALFICKRVRIYCNFVMSSLFSIVFIFGEYKLHNMKYSASENVCSALLSANINVIFVCVLTLFLYFFFCV